MDQKKGKRKEENAKPWHLLKSEAGPPIPLFDVEFQYLENPRNQATLKALILHADDTVNVVAFTHKEELVLVEQFRFGISEYLVELPAGFIDPGESGLEAAKRELREETGYVSDEWKYIGYSYINPSYVTNRCFHYLCTNAMHMKNMDLDHTEDIKVVKIAKQEINAFLMEGGIKDAIGKATISAAQRVMEQLLQSPSSEK